MKLDKIQFLASIAPVQSAIQFDGHGGARIKLDVPDSDIANVMKLSLLRGKVIKVTAEEHFGKTLTEKVLEKDD